MMQEEDNDAANNDEHCSHNNVEDSAFLRQAQQSAKWIVCHWIRQVLWEVACQGLQRCPLLLPSTIPANDSNTATTPSPAAPRLLKITLHHVATCEKLCQQVAKAWSDQLRRQEHDQQQHGQPMAVVADWIEQVANFGRFWEDHSIVLQDMLQERHHGGADTATINDNTNGSSTTTNSHRTPIMRATEEEAVITTAPAQPTTTGMPPTNQNGDGNATTMKASLKQTHLPITKLLRLGKRPIPSSFRPQPQNSSNLATATMDRSVEEDDGHHDDQTEEQAQRTSQLLETLQDDFAFGKNLYYWPYDHDVAVLHQAVDEIPQRLHRDNNSNDGDDSSEEVEAIPKSVWEQQRRERQREQQSEGGLHVHEARQAPNDEAGDGDENNNINDSAGDTIRNDHAAQPSKFISRWVKKQKRYRGQQQRENDATKQRLSTTTTTAQSVIRSNKRPRLEDPPRLPTRLGQEFWTMEQIRASFTLSQQERLIADMVHSDHGENTPPLMLLGALKTVGHVHCALQHAHDMTKTTSSSSSLLKDMDSWSSKQCRRWFRKAVQERLGTHRHVGKDEHGFSFQKFTKVLKTVDHGGTNTTAVTTAHHDGDAHQKTIHWLDLDLGECLVELPTRDGRRTLCAFSSLEVTLMDEDDDDVDDIDDDDIDDDDVDDIDDDDEAVTWDDDDDTTTPNAFII